MQLPGLFGKTEEQSTPESYFGLFLRGSTAVGFLFESDGTNVTLLAKEVKQYSSGWDMIVDDVDELLAVLENETGIRVNQTIFFLLSSFIDQETQEIRDPYRKVLKQISKELELKPLGFIECHEAVKEMIEKKEESVFNGVLVELDEHHTSAFVCKGGKVIYAASSARTDVLGDDLQELFHKKNEQYLLPSRMLLYGAVSKDDKAAITEYQWDEDLFIQTPRVTVLSSEQLLQGLSVAFMTQIAGAAQQAEAPATPAVESSGHQSPPSTRESRMQSPEPTQSEEVLVAEIDDDPDDAETVGFLVNDDIATATQSKPPSAKKRKIQMPIWTFSMPKVGLPQVKKPNLGGNLTVRLFLGVFVLAVLAGGVVAAEYTMHTATIQVTLPSERVSDTIAIEATITSQASDELVLQKESRAQDVEDVVETTGEREVGEPAKGTVVMHNFSDSSVSFSAGTTISVDGKSYSLDSDVSIASATERIDDGVVKEPGTSAVSITAAEIGEDYNVSDGTRFQIADRNSSTFFALAEGSISGGSKETLRTIAQRDVDELSDTIASAVSSADDVKGLSSDGRILLEELTEIEVESEAYSGEVGQEADQVRVNAKTVQSVYYLSEDSVRTYLQDALADQVPDGYRIEPDTISFDLSSVEREEESDRVSMEVNTSAVIIRDVDETDILERVSGNTVDAAQDIIRREYDAVSVQVVSNETPVLFLSGMLPFDQDQIAFEFESE